MSTTTTSLQLRDPADIAEIVPILLGFQPDDSLVAIYLTANDFGPGSTVAMTARIDLPGPDELDETIRLATHHLHHHDHVVFVVFTDDTAAAAALLRHLQQTVPEHQVLDLIAVLDSRIWQLDVDGQLEPASGSAGRISAEAVLAGMPLPTGTRRHVQASIQASATPELLHDMSQRIDGLVRLGQIYTPTQIQAFLGELTGSAVPRLGDDDLAILIASVQAIPVRDAAWASISRADAAQHLEVWRQAATVIDGPLVFPVLGLL